MMMEQVKESSTTCRRRKVRPSIAAVHQASLIRVDYLVVDSIICLNRKIDYDELHIVLS